MPELTIVILRTRLRTVIRASLISAAVGALVWAISSSVYGSLAAAFVPLAIAAVARPTAYVTAKFGRIDITAGPAALSIPVDDIEPSSIERLDEDPEQRNVQALAAVRIAGYALGWHGDATGGKRYFLASNGRHVVRFRTRSGVVVALSIPIFDQDRFVQTIRRPA